eukprot:2552640-Alexandrium_andersonii.AAC.1
MRAHCTGAHPRVKARAGACTLQEQEHAIAHTSTTARGPRPGVDARRLPCATAVQARRLGLLHGDGA